MLSALHNQIEKIVHINGVSKNRDGAIDVFYIETPSEQQLIQVNQIISNWPLEEKKLEKLAKIDVEWYQKINKGWDSGKGILGISANDVALLSANFAMAKEAAALGLPIPSIITVENNQIDFNNIQEMTMLMMQYGAARAEMSKQFAARRRAVEAATTIEEVNGI